MSALIATDLDRTMIYSRNAMRDHAGGVDESLCVELRNGAPLSYMSTKAAELLEALAKYATVVPATTRTIEQFLRVQLPGRPWRYAVTSNGANILVDGVPDPRWNENARNTMRGGGVPITEVLEEIRARTDPSWVQSSRIADDVFHYLVVDLDRLPPSFLPEWSRWCGARGWSASQQGRKIYTMPAAINKATAIDEVHRRLVADGDLHIDAPIFAAGDGALDADMLAAANRGIRPRHGELELIDWQHPSVDVTAASGIGASEEILKWFAAQLSKPNHPILDRTQ